jgi:hypothetical protein
MPLGPRDSPKLPPRTIQVIQELAQEQYDGDAGQAITACVKFLSGCQSDIELEFNYQFSSHLSNICCSCDIFHNEIHL